MDLHSIHPYLTQEQLFAMYAPVLPPTFILPNGLTIPLHLALGCALSYNAQVPNPAILPVVPQAGYPHPYPNENANVDAYGMPPHIGHTTSAALTSGSYGVNTNEVNMVPARSTTPPGLPANTSVSAYNAPPTSFPPHIGDTTYFAHASGRNANGVKMVPERSTTPPGLPPSVSPAVLNYAQVQAEAHALLYHTYLGPHAAELATICPWATPGWYPHPSAYAHAPAPAYALAPVPAPASAPPMDLPAHTAVPAVLEHSTLPPVNPKTDISPVTSGSGKTPSPPRTPTPPMEPAAPTVPIVRMATMPHPFLPRTTYSTPEIPNPIPAPPAPKRAPAKQKQSRKRAAPTDSDGDDDLATAPGPATGTAPAPVPAPAPAAKANKRACNKRDTNKGSTATTSAKTNKRVCDKRDTNKASTANASADHDTVKPASGSDSASANAVGGKQGELTYACGPTSYIPPTRPTAFTENSGMQYTRSGAQSQINLGSMHRPMPTQQHHHQQQYVQAVAAGPSYANNLPVGPYPMPTNATHAYSHAPGFAQNRSHMQPLSRAQGQPAFINQNIRV